MTENVTYCDKHVSSRKCIFCSAYTLKTSRSTTKPYFHRRNLLYPRDPILGPFPELRRRGALIMEGLYINSMAPSIMCE